MALDYRRSCRFLAGVAVDSHEVFTSQRFHGHDKMTPQFFAALIVAIGAAAALYFLREVGGAFDVQTHDRQVSDLSALSNPGLLELGRAIAVAEGYWDGSHNILSSNIPARAHNPGDLIIPGWTGAKLGVQGISVFQDDAEGWDRLYHQLQLIVDGQSSVYTLDDTIESMARKWTSTDQGNWSTIVAGQLGISPLTPLRSQLAPGT